MNAKELRAKYARQVDLAFFRRNVEVDSVDLSAMLDMAEIAEEFYENCKINGQYVRPMEIGREMSMTRQALVNARAEITGCRTAQVQVAQSEPLRPMYGDNGPRSRTSAVEGTDPACPAVTCVPQIIGGDARDRRHLFDEPGDRSL